MSVFRVILSIIFPPLAVLDRGCGSVLIVFILTMLGWIPGVIAALIILNKNNIVDNMHQAYSRDEMSRERSFGIFISGPSKTADIEQALVFGAHGARKVTVILI